MAFLANAKRDAKGRFVPGWHPGMCEARIAAKAAGLKRYIGAACPQGHTERYTRSGACCECRRLDFKAWTAANRDSYNEYARNYYHALPADELERRRARFASKRRSWSKDNRDAVLAGKKQHWQNNREQWRVYIRNRRARLAGAAGFHTKEDIFALRARQNDRCKFCQVDLRGKGDVDHMTPLARGGSNWPHNLQLLCGTCNRKKHAKDPVAHARAIGLLPAAPAADGAQQEN